VISLVLALHQHLTIAVVTSFSLNHNAGSLPHLHPAAEIVEANALVFLSV
jgi:hypothetical protein